MNDPQNENESWAARLRGLAAVAALAGLLSLGALFWFLPLPTSAGAAKPLPSLLMFAGRLHPVVLHLPIGLLLFAAILRFFSLFPPGRGLRPALTLCLWLGAGSALITATAGWLLAQEGGYKGPVFDLHWKFGLAIAGLSLVLLALYHADFRGAAALQGVAWLATLGCLGFGAHQGGSLSHGEDFLSEYAPAFLKPLLGPPGDAHPAAVPAAALGPKEDPSFTASTAVFRQYCTDCHGASKAKGDQRLNTPEDVAKGGKSGNSVVPGHPEKSLVLTRMLLPSDDKKHMPPDGKPQPSPKDVDTLRQWIAAGAPGLPASTAIAAHPAAVSPTSLQSNPPAGRLDSQSQTAIPSPSADPESMKLSTAVTHATLLAVAATASAQPSADPGGPAGEVLKIFKARCIECHGTNATHSEEFAYIDDLAKFRVSDYVNLTNPQASTVYTEVQGADMPRLTRTEKAAGKKKADPLTEEEVAIVLTWLSAGAPAEGGSLIADNKEDGKNKPAPGKTDQNTAPPTPPPAPVIANKRKLVTPGEEITAALTDLQSVPREEQADTRYVSLAFAQNDAKISDNQLENLRRGTRKLLNSLSTAPRVATFPDVGPEKVLLRVRLRDIGWDAALWDSVAAHFPEAIDTGVSAALGGACHATVAILPAHWMAATVARPPLYNEVLRLPKLQQDLEKELGVDLVANLQAGEAMRSGLVKSGISLANRLVERHETGSRPGYYWASYDFRSSGGRGNLLEFPLGPEKAQLAGGQHSFKQAGGEIVFTLPNGFHGYYLADVLGNRLDGAAPTDIVGDRGNITGRVEISNGLSCIICHDKGIKAIEGQDAIRPEASRFSAAEQHLIERLHPDQAKFQTVVSGDADHFAAAVKAADAETVPGQPEPVGALAKLYDGEVTIEGAAAEIGLAVEDLRRKLDDQNQLFALRASFKDGGTLQREHFLDYFADLVERLDIGQVRRNVQPVNFVPLPGRTANPRPIPVELKTDKSTYIEGEELVITVQAAESGHLRLLWQNAAGEIYTLFPNQFITDDRIEGGHPVRIMPTPNPKKAGDEVAIQVAGPNFGTEYLAAIVTDQPFTDDATLKQQLQSSESSFAKSAARNIEGAITKDARVISHAAREGGSGGARAGFARVTLTTVRK